MDPDEALTTLREGERDRQRQAARSLWETSRSEPKKLGEGVETLRAATEVEDSLVRGHAVATLGETLFRMYDYDAPIPELDAVLARLTDEDEAVRQTVTGLLWNREWWLGVGDDTDHPITDEQRRLGAVGLVHCLDDPVFLTRERAIRELRPSLVIGHPDPKQATAAVVAALEDEGDTVRRNAAELLTGVADQKPELLDPHVERLRRAMGEDTAVRSAAAEGLASLTDRFPDLAAPVVRQVIESDPEYSSGEQQRISTLGTVLATESDFEGSKEALSVLESSLTNRSVKVRKEAAAELRRVAASNPDAVASAVPALRERLHDYHDETRKEAARALAMALDPDTAEQPLAALVESVESDDEPLDPWLALADSHPEYVTELLRDLRSERPNLSGTRLAVAAVLERCPAAVHPIVEDCAADLSDDDEERRNGAAWLLGQLTLEHPAEGRRYEEAMRSAIDHAEDFDKPAQRNLEKALDELGGTNDEQSGGTNDKQRSFWDFLPF